MKKQRRGGAQRVRGSQNVRQSWSGLAAFGARRILQRLESATMALLAQSPLVHFPGNRRQRRSLRQSREFSFATTCRFEVLESRTLLAVGPIPEVPSPAAHWTFDEGAGPVAVDVSENGHVAELGAGASWTAGVVGSHALSLDGTSTGVATAAGPVVDTASSFTVSAWVNFASLRGYQTVVSIAGETVAGFYLQLRGDTGTLAFTRLPSDANGSATYVSAPAPPTIDMWYHLAGVNDATAGTISLYVDGQSMGSAPYDAPWQASGDTLIGHGFYNGGQVDYVTGAIDDVELFASALSPEQIEVLDQPAAYSFDDGEGTTAADVSGHGNTMTLGAGASWVAGRLGSNALSVDGTATGHTAYASPVVNTVLPFSVSAWVKLNSLTGFQTFASIDGTTTSAFFLQLRGDTGRFAFARLASDDEAAAATHADAISAPETGVWYNLIGVNDVATGQLLLYVNGVLQSTVPYSGGWEGAGATVVGGGLYGGQRADFVDGEIDDVRFYDAALGAGAAMFIGTAGESIIDVTIGSSGVMLSPDLYGAFMEDINYGAEGGVYSNQIRNSGFNDVTNPLNAWTAVAGPGVAVALTPDSTTGPTSALTRSARLTIASGASASARAGIANSGYFGVAVAPATEYAAEFYARAGRGFTGPLTVSIESNSGTVYASATVAAITSKWTKYSVKLTTSASTPISANNRVVIATNSPSANGATIWFGAAYLYPPPYGGGTNHFRSDLMQWLVDLQPAFFRVPGGNYLEGNTFADRFNWSKTIGPVENRPGHMNSAWGYWSTDGLGLDEYLQMAEAMGAEPILGVYAGYTLNGSSDIGATLAADIVDAVNELHYVLDPVTTYWGALRAANGHPEPYELNYVEIGNEDWFSSTYPQRYPLFYDAIRAEFPDLKIIATSTATGGRPFDVLDDHFYNTPQWFASNSRFYDNVPRGSYEILVGEYAAREGAPTGTMAAALGEAAFLMGLERNADLVTMSAYAPLWANVNGLQWTPDLIGYDNTTSYASPSYYVQQILSQNRGVTVVSSAASGAPGLQVLVSRNDSTYYLTVVNTSAAPTPSRINLSSAATVSSTATVTTLAAPAANAVNSIANPTNIVPATSTVAGLDSNFTYAFPGYSLTILEFTATIDSPTVATPASASPRLVTGTSTNLSVLGAAAIGEDNLTYTWSAAGPAEVSFSTNGSNAAKNATAMFSQAGAYEFTVMIADPVSGASATSAVVVTVEQVADGIAITPAGTTVAAGATTQFAATAVDQFGDPLDEQPAFTWSVAGGVGSVNSAGIYTAPAVAGAATVHAASAFGSADANLAVAAPRAWYQADATSGTTLADSSGNGNAGTLTGAAAWAAGVGGNALELSGGAAVLPHGIVSGLDDFTIAAWIRIDSLNPWSRVFDFGSGAAANMFLTTQANGPGGPLRFAITTGGGGNEQRIDGPALAAEEWMHVAVSLHGTTGTLYVNGVAVGSNASITVSPSDLGVTTQNYLGDSQYAVDPALLGRIDDFRIYSAALSTDQIRQLVAPVVVAPAAAADDPATATPTLLSVLGADLTAGEPGLSYIWSAVGYPPAPVAFSANGDNAAKTTVATFAVPGLYYIEATIFNPTTGLSTSSMVAVAVSLALEGDYDLDGEVGGADFLAWQREFGTTRAPYSGADGTGDGVVEGGDLAVWNAGFGTSSATVKTSAPLIESLVAVAAANEQLTAAPEGTAISADRRRGALTAGATSQRPDSSQAKRNGLADYSSRDWALGALGNDRSYWRKRGASAADKPPASMGRIGDEFDYFFEWLAK